MYSVNKLSLRFTLSAVKLENKRDRRTIEETLAASKAKKMKQSCDQIANNSQPTAEGANETVSWLVTWPHIANSRTVSLVQLKLDYMHSFVRFMILQRDLS